MINKQKLKEASIGAVMGALITVGVIYVMLKMGYELKFLGEYKWTSGIIFSVICFFYIYFKEQSIPQRYNPASVSPEERRILERYINLGDIAGYSLDRIVEVLGAPRQSQKAFMIDRSNERATIYKWVGNSYVIAIVFNEYMEVVRILSENLPAGIVEYWKEHKSLE